MCPLLVAEAEKHHPFAASATHTGSFTQIKLGLAQCCAGQDWPAQDTVVVSSLLWGSEARGAGVAMWF